MSNEKSEFWTLVDKLFREMTPGVYEQAYAEGYAEGIELGKREVLAERLSIRLTRQFGILPDDVSSALGEATSKTLGSLLNAMAPALTLLQVREHLGLDLG